MTQELVSALLLPTLRRSILLTLTWRSSIMSALETARVSNAATSKSLYLSDSQSKQQRSPCEPFRFPDLPPELRNMVYVFAIHSTDAKSRLGGSRSAPTEVFPLSLVSKIVSQETILLYYPTKASHSAWMTASSTGWP